MSPASKYEAGVDPSSPINIEIGGGGDKCVQACDMEVGAGGYVQANIVRVGTSEQIYYHEIRMGNLVRPSRHMGACVADIVAHIAFLSCWQTGTGQQIRWRHGAPKRAIAWHESASVRLCVILA